MPKIFFSKVSFSLLLKHRLLFVLHNENNKVLHFLRNMFNHLNNYIWRKCLKICNRYLSIFSLTQNYSQSIFSPVSCRTYPLSTLMWKENPENGTSLIRQLEHVGWVEVNGRFQFDSKLYPNVEFGFNKRNFLVTTTWVCNLLVTVL